MSAARAPRRRQRTAGRRDGETGGPAAVGPGADSSLGAAAALEPQSAGSDASASLHRVRQWFADQGWTPFPFQEETWRRYLAGESGMIHAATGTGKTYAAWLGPLAEALTERDARRNAAERTRNAVAADERAAAPLAVPPSRSPAVAHQRPGARNRARAEPLTILWVTPLRALANDLVGALQAPLGALGLGDWTVESRTGDTSGALKLKQRDRPPTALVTTPESLSLLLSYPDARERLSTLRGVVVDEWHELLGSKRGAQLELALARLRAWNPALRTWGLSATLQNLDEAARTLVGTGPGAGHPPAIISGEVPKPYVVDTIIPAEIARFPWAGHLGLRLLPEVLDAIAGARSTLLFTNVRSQAEAWYQAIVAFRPDWGDAVALHHGSIDRKIRRQVEDGLRAGKLKCVVCTSSLDLGVDFTPVDQVIQIGSPKGIARLLQRAGRSGHRPGEASRVLCVPTHAFELVEFAAARAAMDERAVEPRRPLDRPLDVLVQHLVTVALAGGFHERELYDEVRTTVAFERLSLDEWRWALDFVTRGGPALRAYPQYARLVERDGWFHVASLQVARLHRLSIGTITGDPVVQLQFLRGKKLGTIEESFIARLRPGDRFVFAGRVLKLVRMKDMTALVRLAPGGKGEFPRWYGARLSFSTQLGEAVKRELAAGADSGLRDGETAGLRDGRRDCETARRRQPGDRGAAASGDVAPLAVPQSRSPAVAHQHPDLSREMRAVSPLLQLQARWSVLPRPGALLLEQSRSRDGYHAYLFPFEGRAVHEGLSALLAYRLAREAPRSITVTSNDYGFELLSAQPLPAHETSWRRVLSTTGLLEDLLASLNAAELDRRQFREIARVAGLVFPGYPGMPKNARQLQASSGLIYDVLVRYDPGNLLLDQARREVLDRQLEVARIREALERIARQQLLLVPTERLTPLAFPLWADRIQAAHVTTEKWVDRVRRMAASLEEAASHGGDAWPGRAAGPAEADGGTARLRDSGSRAASGRTGTRGGGTSDAAPAPAAAGHSQSRSPAVSQSAAPRPRASNRVSPGAE